MSNKGFIFITLIFCFLLSSPIFSKKRSKPQEKVHANSEKATYKWKIKKLIMEYANNRQPEITQGKKILRANTLINDEKQKMAYAYGNVYFYDPEQEMTLTAGQGIYDTRKKEATASQNPILKLKKENLTTHSRIVKIYPDAKVIHLIDNVVILTKDRTIRASEAIYHQKNGKFDIKGSAYVEDKDQNIYGDEIKIIAVNKKITGYTAIGHVHVINKKDKTDIFANQIDYNKKDKTTFASGNVKIDDRKNQSTLYAHQIYQKKGEPSVATGDVRIEDHKGHSVLTADSVKRDDQKKFTVSTGDVSILKLKDKTRLLADQLTIDNKNNKSIAQGSVRLENQKDKTVVTCEKLEDFGKKNYSRLTGNPKIEFTDKNIQAYATVMENDKKKKISHLLGNVIIIDGKKRSYSRWGIYDQTTKKMELTGNPILVDGNSRFSGNKILVDVNSETMSMVGSGAGFFKYKTGK